MNVSMKKSQWTMMIFGLFFLFLVAYFLIVGSEAFLSAKIHQVICASVFILSFLAFLMMQLYMRKQSTIIDERDLMIQKQASVSGMLITLIYVFLLSMILFLIYRDDLYLSVSWMWFMAYSTFGFSWFVTSAIHVYLYHQGDIDEE
jgi:hypothetical protein